MRKTLSALCLGFLAACSSVDPNGGLGTTQLPDQFLDYNEYVCGVQPILIRRCSYLGCHGNPEHAFRLYSTGKLRLGDVANRNDLDAPLTSDEVEKNFESTSGLLYDATSADRALPNLDKLPLLSKPLAARFGGAEHHGIGVFPVYPNKTPTVDTEWGELVAWVGGAKQSTPPSSDCINFFMSMGLTPRGQ